MATITASVSHKLSHILPTGIPIGLVLGPLVGLLIWGLPLDVEPAVHRVLAIVGFMLVYWITEALDLGLTALIGCFLFWVLQAVPSTVAFGGFTKLSPWFVFGALLMGQAASRTGLATRVGNLVLSAVGTSYIRLLIGLITLIWGLNFLVPAPNGQIATLAPLVTGLIGALGGGPRSNMARGLFVMLTYAAGLFGKMFLSSGPSILAHGIIAEQAGVQVLWSQWFLAFLPLALPTIVGFWLIIRWLYPPDTVTGSSAQPTQQDMEYAVGPWSREEQKALCWLLLAITLWATDCWHHLSPAAIGLGLGLLLTLPKIGVLDMPAVKSTNFLLIVFVGGALSLAQVLTATHALDVLTASLIQGLKPLLSEPFAGSITLYWGGFLYHFLVGSEYTMASTMLPVLLKVADAQGYNPTAIGMLWTFAGSGKLFVYQSSSLILGYSFGFFTAKDLLKVGGILTVIEGLLIMLLVPVYWPLIGLSWTTTPSAQRVAPVHAEVAPGETLVDRILEELPAHRHPASLTLIPPALQPRVPTLVPPTALGPDPETEAWLVVRDATTPRDVRDFLAAYPASRFAPAARLRLRQLQRQPQAVTPPRAPEDMGHGPGTGRPRHTPTLDVLQASPSQIRRVQRRLRQAGFAPGPIDGIFGPRTVAALRHYQARHGLPVTGTLDAATYHALRLSERTEP